MEAPSLSVAAGAGLEPRASDETSMCIENENQSQAERDRTASTAAACWSKANASWRWVAGGAGLQPEEQAVGVLDPLLHADQERDRLAAVDHAVIVGERQ